MAVQRPVARTVDEYLARIPPDKRAALERLRAAIHAAVPGLEECISYQMPAFRLDGRVLVWFGAATKHCAFYPGARPLEVHADVLAAHDTSKGTLRFPPERPLPAALVRKLLRVRVAELAEAAASRAARKGAAKRASRDSNTSEGERARKPAPKNAKRARRGA